MYILRFQNIIILNVWFKFHIFQLYNLRGIANRVLRASIWKYPNNTVLQKYISHDSTDTYVLNLTSRNRFRPKFQKLYCAEHYTLSRTFHIRHKYWLYVFMSFLKFGATKCINAAFCIRMCKREKTRKSVNKVLVDRTLFYIRPQMQIFSIYLFVFTVLVRTLNLYMYIYILLTVTGFLELSI